MNDCKDFFQPVLAVDFDGVMIKCGEWKGEETVTEGPVNLEQMKKEFMRLRNAGWKIVVWSARSDEELIKNWLQEHGLLFKFIDAININPWAPANLNQAKKIPATVYLDDRGLTFTGQWEGMAVAVQSFLPWEKAKVAVPDTGDRLFLNCTPDEKFGVFQKCQICSLSKQCLETQCKLDLNCFGTEYLSDAEKCSGCEFIKYCRCLTFLIAEDKRLNPKEKKDDEA